jgi:hypothetical protein
MHARQVRYHSTEHILSPLPVLNSSTQGIDGYKTNERIYIFFLIWWDWSLNSELYHLSHISSPFLLLIILEVAVSQTAWSGLEPPDLSLPSS